MVARSRRILKFIQKVKKSKSFTFRKKLHFSTFRAKIQKVTLFAKSCTFRLFGQFSRFSIFRAKIQKVALFAKSCTFRLFGQFFTFRCFGQKFKKSHFAKSCTFRCLFIARNKDMGYVVYASVSIYPPSIRPFSRRYRIWEYWILPRVSICLSPFPARNIEYGICPLCVSIYLCRIWDIAPRPCLSIPLSNPEILISYASVSIHPSLQPQR